MMLQDKNMEMDNIVPTPVNVAPIYELMTKSRFK